MRIDEPAVIAFAFLPQPGDNYQKVQKTWKQYGEYLKLTAPLMSTIPMEWSDDEAMEYEARLVAARKRPGTECIAEALAFRRRDVLGMGIALGLKGEHPLEAWADLYREIRACTGDELPLGLCFLGQHEAPAQDQTAEVRHVLQMVELNCWRDPRPVLSKGLQWEWWSSTGMRLVVILTPGAMKRDVERRVWSLNLPPQAHHWLNAALLDFVSSDVAELEKKIEEARQQADDRLAAAELFRGGLLTSKEAQEVENMLTDVSSTVNTLTTLSTRLSDVRRRLQSLHLNLTELSKVLDATPPRQGGLLEHDTASANGLVLQAEQSLEHADSARLRASETLKLLQARLTVSQHLLTARQQESTRLQTALVAALLAALGALNTLGLSYKPPEVMRLPLLLMLIGALVAAPLLAAHWYDRPFPWFDCSAAGFCIGAAVCSALTIPFNGEWWIIIVGIVIGGAFALLLRRCSRPARQEVHGNEA
jgi:CASPASE and TPR Repeat-Associated N-terminal domain